VVLVGGCCAAVCLVCRWGVLAKVMFLVAWVAMRICYLCGVLYCALGESLGCCGCLDCVVFGFCNWECCACVDVFDLNLVCVMGVCVAVVCLYEETSIGLLMCGWRC